MRPLKGCSIVITLFEKENLSVRYRELELRDLTIEATPPPKKKKKFSFVLSFCLLGSKFLMSIFGIKGQGSW